MFRLFYKAILKLQFKAFSYAISNVLKIRDHCQLYSYIKPPWIAAWRRLYKKAETCG